MSANSNPLSLIYIITFFYPVKHQIFAIIFYTGVIAGGPARSVVELAGINNIRTKSLGTNNKQNVVLATIEGLAALKTPEEVATLRGKSVEEILG